ncbi:hypothetical protein I350_03198 [Cryptococcus amylolentus CBS 6273]|uniref:Uncharacterized protein n=1 Tax=Cryptococcus amylolentus CBS 6273 TaxID=1296118 RepID=A0A1E3K964_9TREE|nr:hypothetical protein I350_03198 [Cryptococcus amylolentus CBS 6273]
MSKNPIPQDQRLYSGSASQGSASLTTSSLVHSQKQRLAFSGDIEASAASNAVGPHILTDPNPQGDKATPAPAALAHLSSRAIRKRISIKRLTEDEEMSAETSTSRVAVPRLTSIGVLIFCSSRSSHTPAAQPQANPHEFRMAPGTIKNPSYNRFHPNLGTLLGSDGGQRPKRRPELQLRGHTPNDREGDYGSQRPLDSTTLPNILQAPPSIPQEQRSRAPEPQKSVHKLPKNVIQVEERESSE